MPWFASAKYYPCPFSKTVRRFNRERCASSCLYCDERVARGESSSVGNAEGEICAGKKVSTNTLHGVRSVDDLRAWSACCDDRRRYFMEQMLRSGSRSGSCADDDDGSNSNGNEQALDTSSTEEEAKGVSFAEEVVNFTDDNAGFAETGGTTTTSLEETDDLPIILPTDGMEKETILADNQKQYFLEQIEYDETADNNEGRNTNSNNSSFADGANPTSLISSRGGGPQGEILEDEGGHLPDGSEFFSEVGDDDDESRNSYNETQPDEQSVKSENNSISDGVGGGWVDDSTGEDGLQEVNNSSDQIENSAEPEEASSSGPEETKASNDEDEALGESAREGLADQATENNDSGYEATENNDFGFEAAENNDSGYEAAENNDSNEGGADDMRQGGGADTSDSYGNESNGSQGDFEGTSGDYDEEIAGESSDDGEPALPPADEGPGAPDGTSPTEGDNELMPTPSSLGIAPGGDGDPEPDKTKTPTSNKSFTLECAIVIRPTECECDEPVQVKFQKTIILEFELPEPEPVEQAHKDTETFHPNDCCDLLKSAAETICRLHDTIHELNGGPVHDVPPLGGAGGDGGNKLSITPD